MTILGVQLMNIDATDSLRYVSNSLRTAKMARSLSLVVPPYRPNNGSTKLG